MKPTKDQIDREVSSCRDMEKRFPVSRQVDQTAYIVALADRVDELEDRVSALADYAGFNESDITEQVIRWKEDRLTTIVDAAMRG
jgi:hypothetical protein